MCICHPCELYITGSNYHLHNYFTVCSLSKNPIGDEGFGSVLDALIAKPGTLKKLGLVITQVKWMYWKFLFIVQIECMDVKSQKENFTNLLSYSNTQSVSSQFSKSCCLMLEDKVDLPTIQARPEQYRRWRCRAHCRGSSSKHISVCQGCIVRTSLHDMNVYSQLIECAS